MNKDVLDRLKGNKTLDDQPLTEFISTGCYALNRVLTGSYDRGIPVGGILQLQGNSSSGKTLFATTFISSAQKEGWYCKLLDAENTFSKEFGRTLGIDSGNLLYSTPECLEETFEDIENTITQIREVDKETPILLVVDSVAVLPTKEEIERSSVSDIMNTDGARRAIVFGSLLRKITHKLKRNRATLVVINQIRSKIATNPHQNPDTTAAGGRALEFYLSADMQTLSNKTSDVIKEGSSKRKVGVVGRIKIRKNKLGIPYEECDFKVLFDKGLDPYYGLEEWLNEDGLIDISPAGRRSVGDIAFKKDTISEVLLDQTKTNPELEKIRGMFRITLTEAING